MRDAEFEQAMREAADVVPTAPPAEGECRHEYEWVDAGPWSDDIGYELCRFCGRQSPQDAEDIRRLRG